MPYLMIRHRVRDYTKWKPVYDAHEGVRREAGLSEVHLFRNADEPNEVLILFEARDLAKARRFMESEDLREAMKRAGVADKPDFYFLEEAALVRAA